MQNLWRFNFGNALLNFTHLVKVKRVTTNSIYARNSTNNITHSSMDNSLHPPIIVRGMTKLDKEKFKKTINVPCLYLPPKTEQCAIKSLKSYILKLQNFKPIVPISESVLGLLNKNGILPEDHSKVAILDPRKVNTFKDIIENDRLALEILCITDRYLIYIDLSLNYDNWKADEIFRAVIPLELDSVSGYSLVGHILHLNLKVELNDYKNLVGEVLLDKVKCARTVVNKIDIIENTYRNFNMELLCGDNDMVTEVRENKHRYKFDFSKVYWNSRLSTEHERISGYLKNGDIFYDVFAGVGPFSIPAAAKGCITLANDLNPDSVEWLRTNISLNKVKGHVTIFNKDGNKFIKEDVKNHLLSLDPGNYSIHIVMNLPALAVTFIPAFCNLFSESEINQIKTLPVPKLYVYAFAKGLENHPEIVVNDIEEALGQKLETEIQNVSFVRDVAPNKKMMRVTMFLTENILMNKTKRFIEDERKVKKICV